MNKRLVFILAGSTDICLGGLALLVYLGLLPLDFEAWGMPRWVFGLIGAALFFSGLGVVAFQLSRTDHPDR
jgi:hypothetical protein